MGLLNSYHAGSNFWTENPQLLIPARFGELYDADKSTGKEESSKLMYAICFYIDPTEENKFRNIPEEDRKRLIAKDFLKNVNFKWEEYEDLIEYCKDNFIITQAQRSLFNLKKELEDRDRFLNELSWDIETGDKKDKMLANTSKLYDMYDKLIKQIEKESIQTKDRGGKKPTPSDLGQI